MIHSSNGDALSRIAAPTRCSRGRAAVRERPDLPPRARVWDEVPSSLAPWSAARHAKFFDQVGSAFYSRVMSTPAITVRHLALRVREGTLPWDESVRYDTVDLELDGKDLVALLGRYAPAGTDPHGYLGHPVETDMTKLLLGECLEEEFGGRTALLVSRVVSDFLVGD